MAEVTIIVDGQKIQAASGSLLTDVSKRIGFEIPSLCYYPGLLTGAVKVCIKQIGNLGTPVHRQILMGDEYPG